MGVIMKISFPLTVLFSSCLVSLYCTCNFAHGPNDPLPILKLSMREAIKISLEQSESLSQSKYQYQKTGHQYDEAWSSVYPHINAEIKWSHYAKRAESTMALPNLPPITTYLNDKYEHIAQISATQTLWSFGRVSTAIDIANRRLKISQLDFKSKKVDVIYDTKMAYFSLLMAMESERIAKNSLENAINNKKLLYERFSLGRPPRQDLLKINADIAARRPVLLDAESELANSGRHLKMLLNLSGEQRIIPTDNFKVKFDRKDLHQLERELIRTYPTLDILRENIKVNDQTIKIKKASFLPDLSMFASYSLFKGSNEKITASDEEYKKSGVIGLSISIPLWNGGSKIHQYRQSVVERNNSQVHLKRIEKDLKLVLRNAVSSYKSLLGTYKANGEAVRLAEESYNFKKTRFGSGKISITELNDSELMLTSQRLNSLVTLFKINSNLALIEKLSDREGR